jgi:hypothetical protein
MPVEVDHPSPRREVGTRSRRAAALLATAALLAIGLGSASRASDAPASRGTRGEPLLWRVERGGAVSHLLGTCHLALDLERTLGPVGLEALDRARRVFVELDLSSLMTVLDVANTASTRARMPDRSLRALLPAPLWDRLVALHDGHLDADTLDHLKPWSAAFMTYARLVDRSRVVPPPAADAAARGPVLDAAVAMRAKERGIRVEALETPLQQIQVFNAQRLEDGLRMLTDVLLHPEASDESPRIVAACRALDEYVMRKETERLLRRFPGLADRLLVQRNRAWIERLDQWFPDGDMFVAVGAAHMYGAEGLVNGLRRRGYRVTRLRLGEDDR